MYLRQDRRKKISIIQYFLTILKILFNILLRSVHWKRIENSMLFFKIKCDHFGVPTFKK